MVVKCISEYWTPTVQPETLPDGRTVFFASRPELLGIDGSGDSEEEAVNRFQENLAFYLEHLKANKQVLPIAATIAYRVEFSGGSLSQRAILQTPRIPAANQRIVCETSRL